MVKDTLKIWKPCNVYPTAKLGMHVSIGAFSEIGHEVIIDEGTRVGAMCFIPEGVIIGRDCFIGPRVTFTNDKYPPAGKENWAITVVKNKAAIGAGCTILPGLFIGENSLVGAGSVVTRSIPSNEVWVGNPARKIKDISEVTSLRNELSKENTIV